MRFKLLFPKLLSFVAALSCAFSINAASVIRGDVDNDGAVNITDVTTLIDYLLTQDASSINIANADCDGNGIINVDDVTMMIDHLLGVIDMNTPATETFTVNGVTFTMVTVPGGTFIMGTDDYPNELLNESPAHQVTLSTYSIGQTEVTQELWVAVMGNNPCYYTDEHGWGNNLKRPVEFVSWFQCQEFINKLNVLTGKNFRLPTEAEWEFAARGGNKSHGYMHSGSDNIDEVACYGFCFTYGPQTVALLAPNELGLYDMTGNVSEWCQDWFGSYSDEPQVNPTGPSTGYYRIYRGGGFDDFNVDCYVYTRNYSQPTTGDDSKGLRLAL